MLESILAETLANSIFDRRDVYDKRYDASIENHYCLAHIIRRCISNLKTLQDVANKIFSDMPIKV